MAEQTEIRVSAITVRRKVTSPDPGYQVKTAFESQRNYYANEFNVSWLPTLWAMYSPKGQQLMIPKPGQSS